MDGLFCLEKKNNFDEAFFCGEDGWHRILSNNNTPVLRWIPDSNKRKRAHIHQAFASKKVIQLHIYTIYTSTICIRSKQTTISTIPFSCFGYLFSEIHISADQLRCLWRCLPGGWSGCNRNNSRDYELYWLQFGWEPQKTSSFFFLMFFFGSVFFNWHFLKKLVVWKWKTSFWCIFFFQKNPW